MRRKNQDKLGAGLCVLAFMTGALLAGCSAGASPTPMPNPTRTFGPGVYRHAPDMRDTRDARAIGAFLGAESSAFHLSYVAHTER